MNFHEYQAKQLFGGYGIAVPAGRVARTPEEAVDAAKAIGGDFWVVKAQIHAGGRGKAGGVKLAKTLDDVREYAKGMLGKKMATYQSAGVELPIDTVLVTASTPVRSDQTETRFHFYVRNMGDEATNSTVGQAFAAEVDKQFIEDMPIWEHKAHLVRPALADTDGPFMKFRKWYSQFYAEETGDERTVFPPPYWPEKLDDSPAKATASAKYTCAAKAD